MSDDIPVKTIRKNSREEIRVSLSEYCGRPLLALRVWFVAADGGMRPGKDGLNVRIDLLPEIAAALVEAEQAARDRGLIEG